jgi:hypothetical protein
MVAYGMHKVIEVEVGAGDCTGLEVIVADRNRPQEHIWRVRSVRRWQERFMADSVDGLLHDKTPPCRARRAGRQVIHAMHGRDIP